MTIQSAKKEGWPPKTFHDVNDYMHFSAHSINTIWKSFPLHLKRSWRIVFKTRRTVSADGIFRVYWLVACLISLFSWKSYEDLGNLSGDSWKKLWAQMKFGKVIYTATPVNHYSSWYLFRIDTVQCMLVVTDVVLWWPRTCCICPRNSKVVCKFLSKLWVTCYLRTSEVLCTPWHVYT